MKKILYIITGLLFTVQTAAQVGINTTLPTTTLDVNGDLRVRNLPESISTADVNVVADIDGRFKKQLSSKKGLFRAYLNTNFTSGTNGGTIYKILNWNEIEDPNNDFTPSTGLFVAPISGLYRVTITVTVTAVDTSPNNYVLGLVNNSTGLWVMRFTLLDEDVEEATATGITFSFVGAVQLTAGVSYYFGVTLDTNILANPAGDTGAGLGTYFEIELIKS